MTYLTWICFCIFKNYKLFLYWVSWHGIALGQSGFYMLNFWDSSLCFFAITVLSTYYSTNESMFKVFWNPNTFIYLAVLVLEHQLLHRRFDIHSDHKDPNSSHVPFGWFQLYVSLARRNSCFGHRHQNQPLNVLYNLLNV